MHSLAFWISRAYDVIYIKDKNDPHAAVLAAMANLTIRSETTEGASYQKSKT